MSPFRWIPRPLVAALLALASLTAPSLRADDRTEINQLLRTGRLAEAQARVDRQLSMHPKDSQLRLWKGVIQRESGRPYEAITTFTRLTEEHPELPEPYNNLAVIYASMGQYDKARQALEKALRTNPSYAAAHDNLTEVYAHLANQAYSKALQIEPAPAAAPPKLALLRDIAPTASARAPTTVAAAPPPQNAAPVAAARPTAPVAPVTSAPAKSVASAAPAAAAPATVVAARPVTPPAPSAASNPAVAADGQREVEAAVRAWAKAWSDKDMVQYLAAYAKEFDPPGNVSRSAWEQDRRARIVGKARISVALLELQITVRDNRAVAKFRQDYKADTLAVLSRKTLELVKTGGRWQIVKETSGS